MLKIEKKRYRFINAAWKLEIETCKTLQFAIHVQLLAFHLTFHCAPFVTEFCRGHSRESEL